MECLLSDCSHVIEVDGADGETRVVEALATVAIRNIVPIAFVSLGGAPYTHRHTLLLAHINAISNVSRLPVCVTIAFRESECWDFCHAIWDSHVPILIGQEPRPAVDPAAPVSPGCTVFPLDGAS